MKKNLFSMMTIIFIAILSINFASCGSDNDDDNTGGSDTYISNSLVGTWYRDYYTSDGSKSKEVYIFNNGGSGSYRNAYQTATFSYTAANGFIAVKIRYSDSSSTIDDVWSYAVNEKTLQLNGNMYTKQ